MNQGELEIRPACLEDVPGITGCVAAAYCHYIGRIGKPPRPMLEDYRKVVQQHRVFVLVDGMTVAGVLVLITETRHLLLDNVAVHPAYQGQGLGRQLIARAEEEARCMRMAAVALYTNERMTGNIEFYKRLGYVETERKKEQGYHRVYMRKELQDRIS